jgi:ADP-ribose pyrophosphatase YjhB (NUDIX family)
MIDADWERPREEPVAGVALSVAAIVPLPAELGGANEVLARAAFGSARLPAGPIRAGESVSAAAVRILLGTTGARASAERVVYVHEAAGREITLCVLCVLDRDDDMDPRPGVRFVAPTGTDDAFEPIGVGELLAEDLRAGFVRPIAYVRVTRDEFGRERAEPSW